jgi:hypothetical protein
VATIASGTKVFAARWQDEWATSSRYHRIAAFDSALPSKTISRLYKGLSQLQCSMLTLRIGHIRLNTFLYRFKLAPSPLCPCCAVPESVPHFLLTYPKYRTQRLALIVRTGTARLISTKHDATPILAFVRDTGRFPHYTL